MAHRVAVRQVNVREIECSVRRMGKAVFVGGIVLPRDIAAFPNLREHKLHAPFDFAAITAFARRARLSAVRAMIEQGLCIPEQEAFDRVKMETPNYSGRMDNVRAALIRDGLNALDRQGLLRVFSILAACCGTASPSRYSRSSW